MAKTRSRSAAGVGRPRRFDSKTKVRLIMDAAFAVMRRNGFGNATVTDIPDEARLSTRAFYRHFESKDTLLCAISDATARPQRSAYAGM